MLVMGAHFHCTRQVVDLRPDVRTPSWGEIEPLTAPVRRREPSDHMMGGFMSR